MEKKASIIICTVVFCSYVIYPILLCRAFLKQNPPTLTVKSGIIEHLKLLKALKPFEDLKCNTVAKFNFAIRSSLVWPLPADSDSELDSQSPKKPRM